MLFYTVSHAGAGWAYRTLCTPTLTTFLGESTGPPGQPNDHTMQRTKNPRGRRARRQNSREDPFHRVSIGRKHHATGRQSRATHESMHACSPEAAQ